MVLIWKLIEYMGLACFIVLVPQMMGPDSYGSFAVLLSLFGLFIMISGLGAFLAFGRFIPEYEARKEKLKTKALFMQLLIIKTAVVGLLSVFFLFIFPRLLPETSSLTVVCGAGAFFFGAIGATFYQLFYGLNSMNKLLTREALSKPILIVVFIALGGGHDLERAAFALLIAQAGLFLLGLFWARSYFTFKKSDLHFSLLFSHLRFGLLFFVANLFLMAVWRGGEVVVLLFSGKTSEVAFFNIANAVMMTFYFLIGQLTVLLVPSLTKLYVSGKKEKMDALLGYSLKYLTIFSFLILIAVYTLGEWGVEKIMGEQYQPVVKNFKMLSFALFPAALVHTGLSLAMIHNQPYKFFRITIGAMVTFIVVAAFLVPRLGSYGASVAVALALGSAGVIALFQFSMGEVLIFARFWRLVFFSLLTVIFVILATSVPLLMGLFALIFYLLFLFLGNVISIRDYKQFCQIVNFRNAFKTK